ncbi:MAG: DUF4157 domain-containing protein [Myxococcota bacterium]|nr:DUF4157 domain-containing protein [Myxococcota bacterium]
MQTTQTRSSAPTAASAAAAPQGHLSDPLQDPLAVQADTGDVGASGGVQEIAAQAVSGTSSPLPHRDTIQAAFGAHSLQGVQSFQDTQARAANDQLGSGGLAVDGQVALKRTDLHTAAHEAAHVVQQRGGVQLSGGVGAAGDVYERHADAVADKVVSGQSAEGLLDQVASPGAGPKSGGVQLDRGNPVNELGDQEKVNRVGLEEELAWASIERVDKQESANGIVLAETDAQEMGLPVMKLETEGFDRGGGLSGCMELVHGPLPRAEYQRQAYVDAKKGLMDAIHAGAAKSKAQQSQVNKDNQLVPAGPNRTRPKRESERTANLVRKWIASAPGQGRYKLKPKAPASEFTKSAGPGTKYARNQQTNMMIDYDQLGDEAGGFEEAFVDGPDRKIYASARGTAQTLSGQVGDAPSSAVTSLFTHLINNEAIAFGLLADPSTFGQKESKHKFHTMIKASPEDVVMSILSDDEAADLNGWARTQGNIEKVVTGVKAAITAALGHDRDVEDARIRNALIKATGLRAAHGAQALGSVDDNDPSDVTNEDNEVQDTLTHSHPRPSNRVPVSKKGGKSYVVVEQRASAHPLNKIERDPTKEKDAWKKDGKKGKLLQRIQK